MAHIITFLSFQFAAVIVTFIVTYQATESLRIKPKKQFFDNDINLN